MLRPPVPWTRPVAWLLAVSYGVGSPVVAVLEYRDALLSQRFDLPSWLIYLTSVVQVVCLPALFSRRYASGAAILLSVLTLGAMGAHLRIGAPQTALPALIFTVLQLWFAARTWGHARP